MWADQNEVRSITKRGSVIELDGATLGGRGRLHVIGSSTSTSPATGTRAVLTTRPRRLVVRRAPGILEIGDEGLLDIQRQLDLRLSTRYIVDVHGKARLRGQAGMVADFGTTFMLQQALLRTRGSAS